MTKYLQSFKLYSQYPLGFLLKPSYSVMSDKALGCLCISAEKLGYLILLAFVSSVVSATLSFFQNKLNKNTGAEIAQKIRTN